MGDILKRLTNLARSEISHFTHRDHEFSREFMDFFRQQPDYEANRDFFEAEYARHHTDDSQYRSSSQSQQSYQQSHQQGHQDQSHGRNQSFADNQGYDPYAALEVSPNASFEEIEKAYRKVVRRYHPDRFQTAEERETATRVTAIINASYAFLKQKHGKR
jgi:DnaJ-domain-containing protein 1